MSSQPPRSALESPTTDPTFLFEHYRGSYGTELLTAAVAHFRLFDILADAPLAADELRARLGIAARPLVVLTTALRAMGLVEVDVDGKLTPSAAAREHLTSGGPFFVGDYVGLAAESPGVLEMVARLRTNRPRGAAGDDGAAEGAAGAAFIYREDLPSAMEQEASARHLTLALAGRAKNVAPALAKSCSTGGAAKLLDLGGGTGIYSIALVQANPELRALVFDRPEVLKVAREFAAEFGVSERVESAPGDMFADPLPSDCDIVLLSNILHDWDMPECRTLLRRAAGALKPGGRVWIHDVFLNDALDGPLPIALYSAALFTLTEGRAYSAAEYREMLEAAGLTPGPLTPTAIHCGVLEGTK
ncbi:MAG: methyltransferase domain-containing protein [Planctomycetaceae bacterium]|nr:methyltransferase domain-containing protein [Planctomycetaceae bacterium]